MMPQTGLIWSAILPRLPWKYSDNNDRMEKCRRRLNSSMGLHMVRHGGYYIKYPEIKADRRFLKTDGVHLTQIGNQVFSYFPRFILKLVRRMYKHLFTPLDIARFCYMYAQI